MAQEHSRNIARDNHYVPQFLLRQWSLDGKNLWAYRLLVSKPDVQEWRRMPIRGLAYHRDLYTISEGDQETDDFERWLSAEFEQPASVAVHKVVKGARLKRKDRRSLARLLAAQDLRTPLTLLERSSRWKRELPDLLTRTTQESLQQLTEAQRTNLPLATRAVPENEFSKLLSVRVEPKASPEPRAMIRVEMITGPPLWMAEMRHLLGGDPAEILCSHPWSIVEPGDNEEWPITDHPVLKLNYYPTGEYDFGGGWGRNGTDIMMPLSPRKLLFVEVGRHAARNVKFSPGHTWFIRRLLCERAHRWIFATKPKEWVGRFRPRTIDDEAFAAETRAPERRHREQTQSEMSAEDNS